jgi:GT2 family glycosyltransferase
MGFGRFPFELGWGRSPTPDDRTRRFVPGVTGAAMVLRREAVLDLADEGGEVFPERFFAYFEEVDLNLRIAKAGLRCGMDGTAVAWHASRGQDGRRSPALRTHYLTNHWLVSLRNDRWRDWLAELPGIARGELLYYAPRYLATPICAVRAFGKMLGSIAWARRCRSRFEARYPNAVEGRSEFYRHSRGILKG